MEQEKNNDTSHDMGFKIYCSFGNGHRLTKNPKYREIMIQSARTLITRFNPKVGCIRSWDYHVEVWDFPVIIDNMMNLELLFWAFKETKDSFFYKVAVSHANTTMKNHFRPDFSSYHVIAYNPRTGKVVKKIPIKVTMMLLLGQEDRLGGCMLTRCAFVKQATKNICNKQKKLATSS